MLIHNYSIIQFNSNNAHQVVKISGVVKKGNTYGLQVWFVEKLNSEKVHTELIDSRERSKYKNGKKYFREVPISLARYFVLGSLWWNDQKPLLSETGNQTRINSNFIKDSNLIQVDPYQYLNGVTLHFSDSICYELSKPLFYHSKLKNISQLSFSAPSWKEKYTVDFIIFPSSEIYRYFFTAFGINSVNEWMMSPNFYSDFKNARAIAQKAMGNNEFPVFLNHGSNYRGVSTIGNCLHIEEFKSQLRDFQNGLMQNRITNFEVIKRLPLNEMKYMEVIARKVTREADKKSGLLVQQIKGCFGFTENIYKPFFPMVEYNEAGEKRNYPKNNNNSKSDQEDKLELIYGGNTTNDHSPKVKIDLLDMDVLTDCNEDIKLLEAGEFKTSQANLGIAYNPKAKEQNYNVSLPGEYTTGGGKKLTNANKVDAQDFFDGFPEIVKLLKNELIQMGYIVLSVSYFTNQGIFSSQYSKIETKKLKHLSLKDHWEINSAQIEVEFSNIQKAHFIYLFEKKKMGVNVSNRLLLYASQNYARIPISNYFEKLKEFILDKLKKDKHHEVKTQELCLRINSLQTSNNKLVSFQESIQNQGVKLAEYINKALGKRIKQVL